MVVALILAGCTLITDAEVNGKFGVDTSTSSAAAHTGDATETDTGDSSATGETGDSGPPDLDGDGYSADAECDDDDAAVNPDALETCNGIDDNCDGAVDEDSAVDASAWYLDADGDGYGDAGITTSSCAAPSGYVANPDDCDDAAGAVSPGTAEDCSTGEDDDCDGAADGVNALGCTWYYEDADGDGYGAGGGECTCGASVTYTLSDGTDCDDTDAGVFPGANETWYDGTDGDCDGGDDYDADGDGCDVWDDCDDDDPTMYLGAAVLEPSVCTTDADGDGYGDMYISGSDCDDSDASAWEIGPSGNYYDGSATRRSGSAMGRYCLVTGSDFWCGGSAAVWVGNDTDDYGTFDAYGLVDSYAKRNYTLPASASGSICGGVFTLSTYWDSSDGYDMTAM